MENKELEINEKMVEFVQRLADVAADYCNEMIDNNQKSRDGLKAAYPHTWSKVVGLAHSMQLLSVVASLTDNKSSEEIVKIAHGIIDIADLFTEWDAILSKKNNEGKEADND